MSAISTTTYRHPDLSGDPLTLVEMPAMHLRLRRTLVHVGDAFVLNSSVVTISPQPDAASLVAHVEELGRTVDPDFRFRGVSCDAAGSPREWKAFSASPFSLSFVGGLSHVLGEGSFGVAVGAHGRWAVSPRPIDDSLARVVTVSIPELGGGDAGIVATLLVDSDRDVAPHDGRGDARALASPVSTRSLTLTFSVRHVDGTPAADEELVGWSAVVRLGFLASGPTRNISAQVIDDAPAIANGYAMAARAAAEGGDGPPLVRYPADTPTDYPLMRGFHPRPRASRMSMIANLVWVATPGAAGRARSRARSKAAPSAAATRASGSASRIAPTERCAPLPRRRHIVSASPDSARPATTLTTKAAGSRSALYISPTMRASGRAARRAHRLARAPPRAALGALRLVASRPAARRARRAAGSARRPRSPRAPRTRARLRGALARLGRDAGAEGAEPRVGTSALECTRSLTAFSTSVLAKARPWSRAVSARPAAAAAGAFARELVERGDGRRGVAAGRAGRLALSFGRRAVVFGRPRARPPRARARAAPASAAAAPRGGAGRYSLPAPGAAAGARASAPRPAARAARRRSHPSHSLDLQLEAHAYEALRQRRRGLAPSAAAPASTARSRADRRRRLRLGARRSFFAISRPQGPPRLRDARIGARGDDASARPARRSTVVVSGVPAAGKSAPVGLASDDIASPARAAACSSRPSPSRSGTTASSASPRAARRAGAPDPGAAGAARARARPADDASASGRARVGAPLRVVERDGRQTPPCSARRSAPSWRSARTRRSCSAACRRPCFAAGCAPAAAPAAAAARRRRGGARARAAARPAVRVRHDGPVRRVRVAAHAPRPSRGEGAW